MVIKGLILKNAIKTYGLTMTSAALLLGVSRQTLSTWCGKAYLDDDIIDLVKNKLGIDLIKDYELTNPEKLHLVKEPAPRLEAKPQHIASDPDGEFNQKFTELGDGTIAMKVPIVTQRAYAGYLRGYADPEYFDDMPTLVVDVYKEHKGNYIAFEVCGDSMTTLDPKEFRMSIFDGTFVVGREVSRHLWAYKLHTHYVDNWVIVHKTEGILIKKIINHDVESGKITIHSLNPDKQKYPDQVLNLDDVQQIFNIVQKIDKM